MQNTTDTATLSTERDIEFTSFLVAPINDIEEGLKEGHYSGNPPFINKETVRLRPVEGRKEIYIVPLRKRVRQDEYAAYLATKGLRPCVDGPNYLVGLMAQVPETAMPEVLRNRYVVAAESNNPSSVFLNEQGKQCFLCVHRHRLYRILGLVGVGEDWSDRWALLAEPTQEA